MLKQNQHNQNVVIFIHIPKTAGTTFYDAIKFQYRRHHIFTLGGIIENSVGNFEKLSDRQKQQIKFFKGHMTFGLHQFLSCPYTYITILRHPIARITSLYYYLRNNDSHLQHELANNKSLHEFVESCKIHHNCQTRFLAGQKASHSGCSDALKLEIAKENIEKHFACVGIQEQFDETLILFKKVLQWRNMPLYTRQNVSQRPEREPISQATLELIQELNALDIQLFEYAKQRFEDQISLLGSEFSEELQRFRAMNRIYSPIGNLYSLSRSSVLKLLKFGSKN